MSEENTANGGNTTSEDDRKLFVGGLPQEATEDDIKEYFAGFGEVASVNLKMDQMTGRSR
jgi:RNA recognition motif-containing protein